MKLVSFAILALLASAHAHAWDCSIWSQSTNPKTECYKPAAAPASQSQRQIAKGGKANAKSKSASQSTATSTSTAATGPSSADNAGVTTELNDYSSVPRQTPPAFSGYVEPTVSCANARNGGASSPVAGLSFGFSTKDKECDLRETARLFYDMGQPQLAIALLCKSVAAKQLGEACKYDPPALDYPPHERERRMTDRGFPGQK